MLNLCFYFQVHQPFRLRHYKVLEIGHNHDYFDHEANATIMRKVAEKCYLPMNRLLTDLCREHGGAFKCAFSISGVALDQFEAYAPDVLDSFKELVGTGCVELLAETHYHSLSFLFDREEFTAQVEKHRATIQRHFGVTPRVFRNTELTFNNQLPPVLAEMGYAGAITEGVDRILDWRSPNFLYSTPLAPDFPVLLKNYKLSDDIAFRFGNRGWEAYPLTTEKFAGWFNKAHGNGETINLFMDYETFGEHQWADTGIFEFMRHLPRAILAHGDNGFATPSEVLARCKPVGLIDVHDTISWADAERDLSAWLGNPMQDAACEALYGLRASVYSTADANLIEDFRKLTTSDHVYYMCTKYFQDGDVHKYFSPYESPYEGYIAFINAINDLAQRCRFRHDLTVEARERPHLQIVA